jgi:hypothetical protein
LKDWYNVKNRFKFPIQAPIATVVAIISGFVMLAMYISPAAGLRELILDWVMIMAAAALLIGVFNLVSVHSKKVADGSGLLNSSALIIAIIVAFVVKFFDQDILPPEWLLSNVIVPVESALMGLLVITLTYAAVRLISQRPTVYSGVFVLTAIFTLAAGTAIGLDIPFIQGVVKPFITHVLASAGARGILIGVALGIITTGLRIIIGIDRPYGG